MDTMNKNISKNLSFNLMKHFFTIDIVRKVKSTLDERNYIRHKKLQRTNLLFATHSFSLEIDSFN